MTSSTSGCGCELLRLKLETDQKFYSVDEAGDSTLFDRKGRSLVGTEGCSKFFILGFADVLHPVALSADLSALRLQLLSDPYFKRFPSMSPAQNKTAAFFHAKDDLPEVRREVMKLLRDRPVRFFAEVKDKRVALEKVRERNSIDPQYRYHPMLSMIL